MGNLRGRQMMESPSSLRRTDGMDLAAYMGPNSDHVQGAPTQKRCSVSQQHTGPANQTRSLFGDFQLSTGNILLVVLDVLYPSF